MPFPHKFKTIITIVIVTVLIASAFFLIVKHKEQEKKWIYHGVVVKSSDVPGANSVKDPEFVRFPNHTVFRDKGGCCYVVASIFKSNGENLTGIFRTANLFSYNFVGYTPLQLNGKIASYCLYNPDDEKFYLFYSDWKNIVEKDIRCARLGLAVGLNITNPLSFEDLGYLDIEGLPPELKPNLGWDPYIVRIENTYYLLISAAEYGVHMATAETLGKTWKYSKLVINEKLENPTIFCISSKWYMLIGIFNGTGYDLYTSENFTDWILIKKNWFKDDNYAILPAGSTCTIFNGLFYHLYQSPLYIKPEAPDKVPFQLSLASIRVDDLMAEIAQN